jgi:hypothetical protein
MQAEGMDPSRYATSKTDQVRAVTFGLLDDLSFLMVCIIPGLANIETK